MESPKNILMIGLVLGLAFSFFPGLPAESTGGGGNTITICHATGSDDNPWVRIVTNSNSENGHFDSEGSPESGHEEDVLLEGEQHCPQPEEPEPTLGSISVCKVIVSSEGAIGDGEGLESSFTLPGIFISSHPTVTPSTATIPNSLFNTPLSLNTEVISSHEGFDAECVTYGGLELGSYFYGEEIISGDNWGDPLYNDQASTPASSLGSFFNYSGELFTPDSADDDERNRNSDGHIVLNEHRPDRTLVVSWLFMFFSIYNLRLHNITQAKNVTIDPKARRDGGF